MSFTWPLMTSTSAGALPVYGTFEDLDAGPSILKSSPDMWTEVPKPPTANSSLPGWGARDLDQAARIVRGEVARRDERRGALGEQRDRREVAHAHRTGGDFP